MRIVAIAILVFLAPLAAWGDNTGGGIHSPFSLGTGARDMALAGSNLALSDAFTAVYWNPSRLAQIQRLSIGAMHGQIYYSDVPYQYLGLAVPTIDFGSFGLGIFKLGVDDIEVRDSSNFLSGSTSDNRLGLYLAYAKKISGTDFGASISFERQSLAGYSATSSPGINFSLSRGFNHASSWLRTAEVALVGRNLIKPKIKLADEEISLPTSLSAAFSSVLAPKSRWQYLLSLSCQVTKENGASVDWAVGMEHSLKNLLHIRSGFHGKHLTLGAGIGNDFLRFDYAYIDRDLDPLHFFSISMAIGKSISDKKKIRSEKREAEFNRLMNDRLTVKNRDMVNMLLKKGQEFLENGDLPQANEYLEKSLFVARSIGEDTAKIAENLKDARDRLEQATRLHQYNEYLDSAKTMLAKGDYFMARYYSKLALENQPKSTEAYNILNKAIAAVQVDTDKGRAVIRQISMTDSLINSGKFSLALEMAHNLEEYSSAYPEVKNTIRRAKVEYWKNAVSSSLLNGDTASCKMLLDSAAILFPNNDWFANIAGRLDKAKAPEVSTASASTRGINLSPEIKKQLAELYQQAQNEFKNGNLNSAISKWEEVERLSPGYSSVRSYLVNAYKYLGIELYGQNQMKDAIAVWSKALAFDLKNSEIDGYIKRTKSEIQKLQEMQNGQ